MLYDNYTEDLLGLKGAILFKIEEIETVKHINLKTNAEAMVCPHCHFETKKVRTFRN